MFLTGKQNRIKQNFRVRRIANFGYFKNIAFIQTEKIFYIIYKYLQLQNVYEYKPYKEIPIFEVVYHRPIINFLRS